MSNENMKNYIGIILAAGRGNRMKEITENIPKALVEVNKRPLLDYMIEFVKEIGINDIIVVGGYHFEQVKKKVGEIDGNVKVIFDKDFGIHNLISFDKALRLIENKNILVCNADYIFKDTTAKAVAENLGDIAVYCSYDLSGDDEDVMKVKVDGDGNLVEMSKKPTDFEAIYTGIWFFAEKYIPELKRVAAEILADKGREASVEMLFPAFMEKGCKIKVIDIGKADWFEFDTPEELEKARQALEK